jgi:two-component system nitrogen regulation response regulator GlnG
LQLLEQHDWPGNVRELGNVVQRLAVLSRDVVVTERDVEAVLYQARDHHAPLPPTEALVQAVETWVAGKLADHQNDGTIYEQLEALVEKALLRRTLREVRGNQLEAARRLGINRNTLRKKMGLLDVRPSDN